MLREELEFLDKEVGLFMTSYPATELYVRRQCANALNKIRCLRKKRHRTTMELSVQINNLGGMQKFKSNLLFAGSVWHGSQREALQRELHGQLPK